MTCPIESDTWYENDKMYFIYFMATEHMGQVDAVAIFKKDKQMHKKRIFFHLIDANAPTLKKVTNTKALEVLYGQR